MTRAIVLDASVALVWCFQRGARADAVAVIDQLEANPTYIPDFWRLEVANGLAVAERRGLIAPHRADAMSGELDRLPLKADSEAPTRALGQIRMLARKHQLTVYDAIYLELALRVKGQLATLDSALARAADEAGVPLML